MGSSLTISERVVWGVRLILPYAVIFLLFILNVIDAPNPLALVLETPFFLMALYYWTIFRPSLFPLWLAFCFGILFDIIGGFPLGLNAAIYLLCRIVIFDQRRFLMSQSFVMNWLGFLVLNLAFHFVQWALFSLLSLRWLSFEDLWPPVILGVLFFPLVSVILHVTHKILPPLSTQSAVTLTSKRKGTSF